MTFVKTGKQTTGKATGKATGKNRRWKNTESRTRKTREKTTKTHAKIATREKMHEKTSNKIHEKTSKTIQKQFTKKHQKNLLTNAHFRGRMSIIYFGLHFTIGLHSCCALPKGSHMLGVASGRQIECASIALYGAWNG
jgi:hypothetical protein